MSNTQFRPRACGQLLPSVGFNPTTIIANRAPTSADHGEIGQFWVQPRSAVGAAVNNAFLLTSIISGVYTWVSVVDSGGTGVFTNITASGSITASGNIISTVGDIVAASGNIAASLGSVSAGTTLFAGTSISALTTITAGTQITSTLGNFVATNGNFIASTAGTGVILGGGAKVVCGTGDPNASVTAPKGSLYLNLGGSGVADRAYINTNSATAWTAITTVA